MKTGLPGNDREPLGIPGWPQRGRIIQENLKRE